MGRRQQQARTGDCDLAQVRRTLRPARYNCQSKVEKERQRRLVVEDVVKCDGEIAVHGMGSLVGLDFWQCQECV